MGGNNRPLWAAPLRATPAEGGEAEVGVGEGRAKGLPSFLLLFAQQPSLHPHRRKADERSVPPLSSTPPPSFPVSLPGLLASQKPLTQHHQQGSTKPLPTDSLLGASPLLDQPPTQDTSRPQKGQNLFTLFKLRNPVKAGDPSFPGSAHTL